MAARTAGIERNDEITSLVTVTLCTSEFGNRFHFAVPFMSVTGNACFIVLLYSAAPFAALFARPS